MTDWVYVETRCLHVSATYEGAGYVCDRCGVEVTMPYEVDLAQLRELMRDLGVSEDVVEKVNDLLEEGEFEADDEPSIDDYPEDPWEDPQYAGEGPDGPEYFADHSGVSALRRATRDNPRTLPCPTCGVANRLTPADRRKGYQCDSCADRAERGWDY